MTQQPASSHFSAAFLHGRYDDALAAVDSELKAHPDDVRLHWERARCLEQLERFDELLGALELVLMLEPEFAPAIVTRVRYVHVLAEEAEDADESSDQEDADAASVEARARARAARTARASRQAEAELRRALSLDPDNADALAGLSDVLHQRDGEGASQAEAAALLDRAIALAPGRIELREARASRLRDAAIRFESDPDDADRVSAWSGLHYSRSALEAALSDYVECHARHDGHGYALRCASLLHDLGRFDEALQWYDVALARIAPDDPMHETVLEMRARSESEGDGERGHGAAPLASALHGDGRDRSLQDDREAQAVPGTAQEIRAGRSRGDALAARLDDDPDSMLAADFAQRILDVAHEPPPDLQAADPADYPAYQRRFVQRTTRALEKLGLDRIDDGEAVGLFSTLGQHVLIRFFADDSAETGVAVFALQPTWPGLLAWLRLKLTGRWKQQSMVDCVTQFEDGTLLSTQYESDSPFEYGGRVQIERLPRSMRIDDLVVHHLERVTAHQMHHPEARALVARDLEGMEQRWIAGQVAKRDYRVSIGYVTETELQRLLGEHFARLGGRVRALLDAWRADCG